MAINAEMATVTPQNKGADEEGDVAIGTPVMMAPQAQAPGDAANGNVIYQTGQP